MRPTEIHSVQNILLQPMKVLKRFIRATLQPLQIAQLSVHLQKINCRNVVITKNIKSISLKYGIGYWRTNDLIVLRLLLGEHLPIICNAYLPHKEVVCGNAHK